MMRKKKSKRNCKSKRQSIKKNPIDKDYWKETIIWNTSPEPNLSKQSKLSDVNYEVKEEWRKEVELEGERKLGKNREECAKGMLVSSMAQMLTVRKVAGEPQSLWMRAGPNCTWLLGGISKEV